MSGSAITNVTSELPFLVANDRYQVVALPNRGSTTSTFEFRYWFAGEPLWDEELASDSLIPPYHAVTEGSAYVPGSLELPYRLVKPHQEWQIDEVIVEFVGRPTVISESLVDSAYSLGFTGRVEGIGITDLSRTVSGAQTSGVVVSSDFVYADTANAQDSASWPNVKTVKMAVRLGRVRGARVVLTDIHLCKILRVQLVGKIIANRNA